MSRGIETDFERNYASIDLQRKVGKSLARLQMFCSQSPEPNMMDFQHGLRLACPASAPARSICKYWPFYKVAAMLCNVRHWSLVNEVVNPSKYRKLAEVAFRHEIGQTDFERVSRELRRVWPLFP